mmetsp:Transcript_17925/g.30490  ORF Transcript_17925/g.30490 Transcript_17925/m.30490 type:complete len:185 (-) Transcript_17925:609-1163(-)
MHIPSKRSGTFEAPSDWTIIIDYTKPQRTSGLIKFSYWVDPYTADDDRIIKSVFQPTGTEWVNQTALAIEKEKEEERMKQQGLDDQQIAYEFTKQEEIEAEQRKIKQLQAQIFFKQNDEEDDFSYPTGIYFNQASLIFVIFLLSVVSFISCLSCFLYNKLYRMRTKTAVENDENNLVDFSNPTP